MVYVLHDVKKKYLIFGAFTLPPQSAVPSTQISVEETGKNQQEPGQDSTGDTPAMSHSSLIGNP
jgi:hypothetical protein